VLKQVIVAHALCKLSFLAPWLLLDHYFEGFKGHFVEEMSLGLAHINDICALLGRVVVIKRFLVSLRA
jgi:hypothetical protein